MLKGKKRKKILRQIFKTAKNFVLIVFLFYCTIIKDRKGQCRSTKLVWCYCPKKSHVFPPIILELQLELC